MGLVKTRYDIKNMQYAGKILAEIFHKLIDKVAPGISTGELNRIAEELCQKYDVIPAFKGYNGFPAVICTGVDDVAVHGIPSDDEILKEGQIVSIDMGVIYNGYYSDSAHTIGVGQIDSEAQRLLNTTKQALNAAIQTAVAGKTVGDIGYVIEKTARLAGFNVIKDMTGHGIGKSLHEKPEIPCFGRPSSGMVLESGMTIAIEPMINEGSSELKFCKDGWTTRTLDGSRSAIFEHTLVVRERHAQILTAL